MKWDLSPHVDYMTTGLLYGALEPPKKRSLQVEMTAMR